jgi:hypothetical protein
MDASPLTKRGAADETDPSFLPVEMERTVGSPSYDCLGSNVNVARPSTANLRRRDRLGRNGP